MKKLIPVLCMIIILFSCNNPNPTKQESEQVNNADKNLMVIFAHPDDEGIIAPILSKYAKEGANIYLVIVTDGSKGVTPHANIPAGDSLAKIRSKEALCVTKILGINPPIFLNYIDGDLALRENMVSLDDKIDSLFAKYQPDVVISFGPDGGYGHPDHRIVSNIVTEVFQREASETLQQLLYYGFPTESIDKELLLNTNLGKWLNETWKTSQMRFLSYRIPIDEEDLKLAYEASTCHKTQYTPEVMDDLHLILQQTDGIIYFRPWNGSKTVKDNIFE